MSSHFDQVASQELTSSNFFLWGWLKEHAYYTKLKTLEEFEERIYEIMFSIPLEILVKSVDTIAGKLVTKSGVNTEF